MLNFNYIIENPPFLKIKNISFLICSILLLQKSKGKMSFINPSTWLIYLRLDTENYKLYKYAKELLKGHVNKVIIENLNKSFNIKGYVPLSIIYVDFSKLFNNIDFICCGEKYIVNNLEDCNLIGNWDILLSIIKKTLNYPVHAIDHIFKKDIINNNLYFIPYSEMCATTPVGYGSQRPIAALADSRYVKTKNGEFYKCYINTLFHTDYKISKNIQKRLARGGSTALVKRYLDKDANCLYGAFNELKNWEYYVFSNTLPLFLNLCFIIDLHNTVMKYVPWIVDKKYTDIEIYKLLNFSDEEILLIEKTVKKFERNSKWFIRYLKGL